MSEHPGTCYLLHADEPIGDRDNPRAQAQHYLGWAHDLDARLEQHHKGTGAALTRAFGQAGVNMSLVRTWTGDRNFERWLKNKKNARKLCPVCNPALCLHDHEELQAA